MRPACRGWLINKRDNFRLLSAGYFKMVVDAIFIFESIDLSLYFPLVPFLSLSLSLYTVALSVFLSVSVCVFASQLLASSHFLRFLKGDET